MKQHLYEVLWQVETDSHSFLYREFKVLCSKVEAEQYGRGREEKLNEGVSIEEKAQDGYCFKYLGASKLTEIDGFKLRLVY